MRKLKKACPERSRRGFTLIELLIVILIIGILATIAIVSYNGATARAKKAATVQTMNDTIKAVAVCVASGDSIANVTNSGGWGKTYLATPSKPLCTSPTGGSAATSAKWPDPSAFSQYKLSYGSYNALAVNMQGDVMWVPDPHMGTVYLSGDYTGQTSTFSALSGGSSMNITCTVSGCK